ncbi:HNH endonuclease [Dehalogenimonas lykanthroporepellens BL-DC-9]|nr:HNH endonuclease [Dehalogenimonas lykanthroporepellens BL-DC-9]
MARNKKVKDDFIFAVIFISLIALALIMDWWKANAVLGWTIIGIVAVSTGFFLYKSGRFRASIKNATKSTATKLVFENEANEREPLPPQVRQEVMRRAKHRCENEECSYSRTLHIHHIDMDNSNNRLFNLIALCPNCHKDAHNGYITSTQCRNWVNRDYHQLKVSRFRKF